MRNGRFFKVLLSVLTLVTMLTFFTQSVLAASEVLIDQANYCNEPAANPGDPSFSRMYPEQQVYGFGCQMVNGTQLAEIFTLDQDEQVGTIELFAYQTGSSTTSTFTGAYVAIYDGNPMTGGNIIWGDMTTNRISSTDFTGCYRVLSTSNDLNRPIMRIVANVNTTLDAGTYWFAFMLDGSLGSGPWGVPGILESATTPGTAIQYTTGGWNVIVDSGTDIQASIPYRILGPELLSQEAPAAPVLKSRTSTAITLETIAGAEYKMIDGAWQSSPTFTGLNSNTDYTFYARLAATATHLASPASTGAVIRTDRAAAVAPAAPEFASKTADSVTLKEIAGAEYRRGEGAWQSSPLFGGLASYADYTFYARIAETESLYASPSSPGTVIRTSKAPLPAPTPPVVASASSTSITLVAVPGAEYRLGEGSWQSSPVFSGLSPKTTYSFTMRLAETEIALASPASAALLTITSPALDFENMPATGESDQTAARWAGVFILMAAGMLIVMRKKILAA